jgi:photosystem II stability/assembly factor-like uncharacterized protein
VALDAVTPRRRGQAPAWTALAGFALAAAVAVPCWSAGWAPLGGPLRPEVFLQLSPPGSGRPLRVYASVLETWAYPGAYLWRSKDAGATWRDLETGLGHPLRALAIDPANPDILWAWTLDNGLWRSADAGDSWEQRALPGTRYALGIYQLLVDPHHPGTLYTVEEDSHGPRVVVSRDGGATFDAGPPFSIYTESDEPIHVQPARGELLSFAYEGLVASLDGGQTWQLRGRFAEAGFHGGEIAPSAPDTLYGLPVFGPCLARSDDDGAHWRRLAYPPSLPSAHASCNAVAVDPRDPRHVWVGATIPQGDGFRNLLFASRDGGTTWSRGLDLPAQVLRAAGGEVLYAGGGDGAGVSISEDGGHTWTRRDRGIVAGDLCFGLAAQRAPGGGGRRLVALNVSNYGAPGAGLFRSDGGRDWTEIPFRPTAVADAGGSNVVAADEHVVMRSPDGGATWNPVPSAPAGFEHFRADLAQPGHLLLLAEEITATLHRLVVWASDDAGATWRPRSHGLPIDCPDVVSVDICPEFNAYTVDPFDPSRRWVSYFFFPDRQPSTVFRTLDGGATWQPQTTVLPDIHALAADPAVPGRLLAATDGGLFDSPDGGDTWLPLGDLPDGAVVRQFARDGATWYAATTAAGIFRSTDGGAHWTLLAGAPDLDHPTIAVDPRRPAALLAAFAGQGVWRWTP